MASRWAKRFFDVERNIQNKSTVGGPLTARARMAAGGGIPTTRTPFSTLWCPGPPGSLMSGIPVRNQGAAFPFKGALVSSPLAALFIS